jgi:hypothetical protein
MEEMERRGECIIPSPEVLDRPLHYQRQQNVNDAFKTRLYYTTVCTRDKT